MRNITSFTHYMPKKWRGEEHTIEVKLEVMRMFENKLLIFLREIASIVMVPYVVWKVIGDKSDDICHFFSTFSSERRYIGWVCKFANFSSETLKECGNSKYGPDVNGEKKMQTRQGKLEKSILNFKANNGGWKMDEERGKMVRNISKHINLSGAELGAKSKMHHDASNKGSNESMYQPHSTSVSGERGGERGNVGETDDEDMFQSMTESLMRDSTFLRSSVPMTTSVYAPRRPQGEFQPQQRDDVGLVIAAQQRFLERMHSQGGHGVHGTLGTTLEE